MKKNSNRGKASSACNVKITNLAGHGLRVELTHVSASVGRLNILQRQLPLIADAFEIDRLQQRRSTAAAAAAPAPAAVEGSSRWGSGCGTNKSLTVDRTPNPHTCVAGNYGVIDRQYGLCINSYECHLKEEKKKRD